MTVKRSLLLAFALALVAMLTMSIAAQGNAVVVRMWTGSSSPAEDEALQEQIAAFEAANPDVDVELLISPDYSTQLQAAFASGDYPEVFSVGQFEFPSYQNAGVIAEGQDLITEIDDIYPSLLNAFSVDGTAYCAPKDFSTLALYYNKDAFDAAGVDYPTADWTWDDMHAAAEAITNADVTNSEGEDMTGFSAQIDRNRWLAFLYANGGTLFNDEGEVVFDSDQAIEALNFYASFINDDIGAAPGDLGGSGWNGEAFGRGLAAMTVEGNWAIGYLNDTFPELNWGVAEIPTAPLGEKGTLTFTVCWGVSAQAEGEVADAAWKLVNFLTGPEGAEFVATSGFGVMPARASFGDQWLETRGEEFQPFVAGANYAVAPVFPLGYADFTSALDEATTAVLTGEEDADSALGDVADVAREIQEEQAG